MTDKLEESVAAFFAEAEKRNMLYSEPYRSIIADSLRAVIPIIRNAAMDEAAAVAKERAAMEIFEDHRGFCRATANSIAQAILAKRQG